MGEVVSISEEEVMALSQSILTRYGIDFTCYEFQSLRRRIIRLLNKLELKSTYELWVCFLRDPNFVHTFMNEISVGMTSMFRDPGMWRGLKDTLTSQYLGSQDLSIWHAGCSTGEEVYSMGILLRELGFQNRSNAFCTDINIQAMEEAKQGEYHKIKMIENENNYRLYNSLGNFSKYYEPTAKHVKMDQQLIQHARFSYHNLITDSAKASYDIIFCRNVMIYFDAGAKKKLLQKFYDALKPGGILILGFLDTLGSLIDSSQFSILSADNKFMQRL